MILNNAINILMIEDNSGDQFLISELISGSDIKINNLYLATSLESSLKMLNTDIDIILLDLTLPDSNGINSFNTIIKHAGKIPVVILSGYSDTILALEAIGLGAQDYLLKGDFDEKLLAKTIRYSIERKKNIEELRESIERYNLVSMATNDMVWDWNIVTGKVYRNVESWNKLFGTSLKHIDQNTATFIGHVHPEDVEHAKKNIDYILAKKDQSIFQAEFRVKKEDGKYAYVSDRGYIIRNAAGNAIRVIGATQNITERKEAEVILKSSEERYRYLFNNNPSCIIIWDLNDLCILEVNDSSIDQYKYSREEFKHKSILDLKLPEDSNIILEVVNKAKDDIFFKGSLTCKHVDKTGKFMFMDVTCHRIEYKGKAVILTLANNVTETILLEKKLEEEKIIKQQEITEAVIMAQEKERQEIGGELHDNVNQILASSKLYLGLAKMNTDEYSKFLNESEKLITSAIAEIRALSHSLIPPSLDDSELAEALESIIVSVAETGSLKINADLKRFNENSTPDKLKLGIYRIVQEQFNNILKYAKATIVDLTIAHENEQLILSIKDNGVGFDKKIKTEGVGLLNIKARASLFNGKINIISSPGNGCEVVVTFN